MRKINRKTFLLKQIAMALILFFVFPLVLYGLEMLSNFLRLSPVMHNMARSTLLFISFFLVIEIGSKWTFGDWMFVGLIHRRDKILWTFCLFIFLFFAQVTNMEVLLGDVWRHIRWYISVTSYAIIGLLILLLGTDDLKSKFKTRKVVFDDEGEAEDQ